MPSWGDDLTLDGGQLAEDCSVVCVGEKLLADGDQFVQAGSCVCADGLGFGVHRSVVVVCRSVGRGKYPVLNSCLRSSLLTERSASRARCLTTSACSALTLMPSTTFDGLFSWSESVMVRKRT